MPGGKQDHNASLLAVWVNEKYLVLDTIPIPEKENATLSTLHQLNKFTLKGERLQSVRAKTGMGGNSSFSFFLPLSFSAEKASFMVPPVSYLDTSRENHAQMHDCGYKVV